MATPRKLSAREVLADIKSGTDDAALMEKYSLSPKGLQSLFKKLIDAGVVNQADLDKRRPGVEEKTIEVAWRCPACGKPQTKQVDTCPDCGVIVSKFKAKQPEHEKAAEVENTIPKEVERPVDGLEPEPAVTPTKRFHWKTALAKVKDLARTSVLNRTRRLPLAAKIGVGVGVALFITGIVFLSIEGKDAALLREIYEKVYKESNVKFVNPPRACVADLQQRYKDFDLTPKYLEHKDNLRKRSEDGKGQPVSFIYFWRPEFIVKAVEINKIAYEEKTERNRFGEALAVPIRVDQTVYDFWVMRGGLRCAFSPKPIFNYYDSSLLKWEKCPDDLEHKPPMFLNRHRVLVDRMGNPIREMAFEIITVEDDGEIRRGGKIIH